VTDVLVKPAFQSAYPDSGDTTKFGPNAWNAARLFSGGNAGDVLVRDTGSATGASWQVPGAVAQGGTGLSSYTIGDLLYASGTTTLAKLADVAVGRVLVSGGVGVAPAWSATPSLTSVTIAVNQKYGFATGSGGLGYDGTFVNFFASDAGAYFRLSPGNVVFNSSGVEFQNGGTAKFKFAAMSTTDAQIVFTNGAASSGFGWDITTDGLVKFRTRAQTGDASISTLHHLASGYYEGTEMTPPAAGAVNTGRLYFDDNGAGKTRLMCLFNTGAAQQIAIQP